MESRTDPFVLTLNLIKDLANSQHAGESAEIVARIDQLLADLEAAKPEPPAAPGDGAIQ